MSLLMPLLQEKMGTYVDIEFSYEPLEDSLELLQARPLWINDAKNVQSCPSFEKCETILQADRMVTDGEKEDISYLVYIDPKMYTSTNEFKEIARTSKIGRASCRERV